MSEFLSHLDLVFAHHESRELGMDLLVPVAATLPKLVMVIHGGGWREGNRKDEGYEWLVDHGYAIARIEYRHSSEGVFPAQLEDCREALRWLRKHAVEYHIEATRTAVLGTSAGGQLALLLGCDPSSDVAAVIAYCPPCDLFLRAIDQPQTTDRKGGTVYDLLGSSPAGKPELARLASPAHAIHSGTAPCLIFHCSQDTVIYGNQALALMAACFKANVDATLVAVPHGHHCDESMRTGNRRETALAFLRNHLR